MKKFSLSGTRLKAKKLFSERRKLRRKSEALRRVCEREPFDRRLSSSDLELSFDSDFADMLTRNEKFRLSRIERELRRMCAGF
jgi:hypothetical protein